MTPPRENENKCIQHREMWIVPFAPLVFFLPMFYKYGVIITGNSMTFGYGFSSPMGLSSKTIQLKDIKTGSIAVGSATWKDNLTTFGGWGIRLGLNGTTAYNPTNGNYIELVESKPGEKERKYRFVSKHVKKVVSLIEDKHLTE